MLRRIIDGIEVTTIYCVMDGGIAHQALPIVGYDDLAKASFAFALGKGIK